MAAKMTSNAIQLYQKELQYNNDAIFEGIIDIYSPRFVIYGPPVRLCPRHSEYINCTEGP